MTSEPKNSVLSLSVLDSLLLSPQISFLLFPPDAMPHFTSGYNSEPSALTAQEVHKAQAMVGNKEQRLLMTSGHYFKGKESNIFKGHIHTKFEAGT